MKMENGHEERLSDRLSEIGLNDSSPLLRNDVKNENLFQVMKAVEAAEDTIKQQVEENSRLKAELQRRTLELEKYKSDESLPQTSHYGGHSNKTTGASLLAYKPVADVNRVNWNGSLIKASNGESSGMLVVHHNVYPNGEEDTVSNHVEGHFEGNMDNGVYREAIGSVAASQLYPPSATSSPMRMLVEGEYVSHMNSSTHELMPVEVNSSSNTWKEDLIHKTHEQEQEILQLRKYLTNCSVKEAQIRNENYVLEKRNAYMRLAFDQQQQDLIDASSKALSYRQEIIEENIRLTYALQATQQERSVFVSYLLPLLSEYSLQPQVSDAQSIVSHVKVLFRHLQEKLILTETKLKEAEYQLAPWQSHVNHSTNSLLSPSRVTLTHSKIKSLDLVPHPPYSHDHRAVDWDSERQNQDGPSGSDMNIYHLDGYSRSSPLANMSTALEMPVQPEIREDESHGQKQVDRKHVKFCEPLGKTVMENADVDRQHDTKNSSDVSAFDDPSSSNSPLLSPVQEDPSSSFSEAGDDDPLPGIDDLQISGEAYPGHELQACGFSINGTTSCNFEWVCHLDNGSVNYIDGAKQPNYLVTADDVDLYLAIEVQPLDDRNRKGELVKVFANDNRKITCHPEMQNHVMKNLRNGHALYKVSLATGFLDIWEAATLSIKREGYNIKCTDDSTISEKFSASTSVTIPYGQPAEFAVSGSDGSEHLLRVDYVSEDFSCSRDTIVLTLRLFIMKALQRKKGKKKGFLFNK